MGHKSGLYLGQIIRSLSYNPGFPFFFHLLSPCQDTESPGGASLGPAGWDFHPEFFTGSPPVPVIGSLAPIGSLGLINLLYLHFLVDFDGFHVGKYTSFMDSIGRESERQKSPQKGNLVFQTSIFRCELLVSGRVVAASKTHTLLGTNISHPMEEENHHPSYL